MIATADGVYVDECDPLFDILQTYATWSQVKRHVGRNLLRSLCGDHILISSAEDYPEYREIRTEIAEACRSVNAPNRVPEPHEHRDLATRAG
jgi:hypothetical protein